MIEEEFTGAPLPPPRRTVAGRLRLWGERLGIVLIVLGIAGLIQPWVQAFFTNGFTVLLAGTIIFIIASHISDKGWQPVGS